MTIHETIKNQIKDAMRAKEALRLEVLRGLTAAFSNELIAKGPAVAQKLADGAEAGAVSIDLINDEAALALIKRSVKQHKDSIEQFTAGGRADLADKERAELVYLEAYLPATMSQDEIKKLVVTKIASLPAGKLDKTASGKFMGEIMRELKGKADGSDVKAVIEGLIS
jgi:uncharacterized protein YqeY